jgi:hypothetical protein
MLSPKLSLGIAENISSQIAGAQARLLPPGHSSYEKIIGQFSIAIFTPRSPAYSTSGGQISRKRTRFSGSGRSLSLPANVPTTSTPSRCAASSTLRRWPLTCSRCSSSGWRLFG